MATMVCRTMTKIGHHFITFEDDEKIRSTPFEVKQRVTPSVTAPVTPTLVTPCTVDDRNKWCKLRYENRLVVIWVRRA